MVLATFLSKQLKDSTTLSMSSWDYKSNRFTIRIPKMRWLLRHVNVLHTNCNFTIMIWSDLLTLSAADGWDFYFSSAAVPLLSPQKWLDHLLCKRYEIKQKSSAKTTATFLSADTEKRVLCTKYCTISVAHIVLLLVLVIILSIESICPIQMVGYVYHVYLYFVRSIG